MGSRRFYNLSLTQFIFAGLALLAACAPTAKQSTIDAAILASDAHLEPYNIILNPFTLLSYERFARNGAPVRVYIEGDGRAWINKRTPSDDPTPTSPLAFMLAAQDKSANVIYLARPCQYLSQTRDKHCAQKYWTSHRFAPEIITAFDKALDDIKSRHGAGGFELIGFSGGANIAALIAARRQDIVSLRTIAGNLDHKALNAYHHVSQIPYSLNAKDVASDISHLPQHHFIGMDDNIITPAIVKGFVEASGDTPCIRTTMVPGASHTKGWDQNWPRLLQLPVDCNAQKK